MDKGTKLGLKVVRQPEGEVVRQTKFVQSTQPLLNPIRDRSGRFDDMQDERKTTRSQEINVHSLTEELSFSDCWNRKFNHVHLKTGRVSMLSRLMTEQGDQLLRQVQYKTILKYVLKWTRSTLKRNSWNNGKIHCCSWQKPWTDDGERGRHGFQNSRFTIFRSETRAKYQRSRIYSENWEPPKSTCLSTRFMTINHLIISVRSQNKWFVMLRTSLCVNNSRRRNPKRSAKYVDFLEHWLRPLHMRVFLAWRKRGKSEIHHVYNGIKKIPEYVIKKGRLHGHRYGKKPGDREYYIANQLKKKYKKKFFLGIHDRFIQDETFRDRMIENGRENGCCCRWRPYPRSDPQEYYHYHYNSNWWLTSKQDRLQYFASGAQTWFSTSIVHIAAIETKRSRSSQKSKIGTKFFFFFMVELARFLVDSFLWKSPWRWTMY